MFNVKLLTILLTCAANLEYLSFAMARSSSMHRLIKRSLNGQGCGIKEQDIENIGQIVGGEQSIEKWPWMVSLSHNGHHNCGGSVLDKRHVITAAHCFEGENDHPEQYTVTVGQMELGQGEQFSIERIINHEEYSHPPNFFNDIALLILASPLPDEVVPICLPEQDEIGETETLTITGFGTLQEGGDPSHTLQEVDRIPYINPEKCNSIIQDLLGEDAEVTQKQLCTGADDGGRGSCQGDSGGPVIHMQPDKSWSLVGLVSYSIGCVKPGIPTVHTRLHAYRDWIQMHMVE